MIDKIIVPKTQKVADVVESTPKEELSSEKKLDENLESDKKLREEEEESGKRGH